jgi:23S rRNA (guanine2445-N2)-methyltransferase / 23S rRNA (guanine2069-N7)-methyltransferase
MARALVFVATCALGLEGLLATELRRLGLQRVHEERGAVRFHGKLRDGYRASMWSRLASRVLWRVTRFECADADALYEGVRGVDWSDHIRLDRTFAVRFAGTSRALRDERFSARKVKDAVCDELRDVLGGRPDIDPKSPDARIMVRLRDGVATVHLDLSGPMHERGGGRQAGPAPLRETLAAAMLHLAEWPRRAREGQPLLDPMCGSGTLVLEAAGMAAGVAPGRSRERWPHASLASHDAAAWEAVCDLPELTPVDSEIVGRDLDRRVLSLARRNAASLGLDEVVRFEKGDARLAEPVGELPGVIVTNPPYGERISEAEEVAELFDVFGAALKARFTGWQLWLLAGPGEMIRAIGMKSSARIPLRNGQLRCTACRYDVR